MVIRMRLETVLGLPVPQWFFVSGWSNPRFTLLTQEARQAGACIILMADNRRMHNIRQAIGSFVFRMKLRRLFDYVFVPGISGTDLMRFFGVPEHRIRSGLYGADPQVFSAGPSISTRERDFLFVGRFIEVKGLRDLIRSVTDFEEGWRDIYLGSIRGR